MRPAKQWLRLGSSDNRNLAAIAANQSCKKRQNTFEIRQPQLKGGEIALRSLHCASLKSLLTLGNVI